MEDKKIPIESQRLLLKLMNDTPSRIKLHGTEWEIKNIKAGAAMMIAERVLQCSYAENDGIDGALVNMAKDGRKVAECITIALINDWKQLNDTAYFESVYDTLMNCEFKEWTQILIDVIRMIDVRSFMQATNSLLMFKEWVAGRKMTEEEAEQ